MMPFSIPSSANKGIYQFFCALLLALLIVGCEEKVAIVESPEDPILAEVYDYKLHYSDLEELILSTENEEDSLVRLRILVNNWVRDKLILKQAESAVEPDFNLRKLLDDYRSSLLVHNFERMMVADQIDSAVSLEELKIYYDQNTDQYQLESPIIKCYFIKAQVDHPMKDSLEYWWESEEQSDFEKLVAFCNEEVELFMLDSAEWYQVDEITQLLPLGSLSESSMRPDRDYQFSNDGHRYYIRVLERIKTKETAPLAYIEEQATRYIMHQRKLTLLEQIKNDIYEEGIQGRFVKINVK